MRNWIRSVPVRVKLWTAFFVMLAIGLILGAGGLISIRSLAAMSNDLVTMQNDYAQIADLRKTQYTIQNQLMESLLNDTPYTGELDPQKCVIGQWLTANIPTETDPLVLATMNALVTPHNLVHEGSAAIVDDMNAGDLDKARADYQSDVLPSLNEVYNAFETLMAHYNDLISHDLNTVTRMEHTATIIEIAFLAVAAVAGVLFVILIPPILLKPITVMSAFLKKAARGDFSIRLDAKFSAEINELFHSCNALITYTDDTVSNLSTTITTIRMSAQSMMEISLQMNESSNGLAMETSGVSTSMEEFSVGVTQSSNSLSTASIHISTVASAIEEMNATISTIAAAAEETSTRVQQSSRLVDNIQESIAKASGSVTVVAGAFNSVAKSVGEINQSISVVSKECGATKDKMQIADDKAKNTNLIIMRLENASKQIGKIVGVINDIADQTNMLALNAAIEAAGAGEAGKGFMVVANEVKELAKQTAGATDEIADQIENMQHSMGEAVSAVTETTKLINEMSAFMNSLTDELVKQNKRSDLISEDSATAAHKMDEVNEEISRLSENAVSVTKTVIESAKGTNEIAKSTAELVIGVQDIAMNAERVTNNIREIERTSKEMATGIADISKNVHLINQKTTEVQINADSTRMSCENLFEIANEMDAFVTKLAWVGTLDAQS